MRWRQMTDHQFAQRRLSAYVDDELSAPDRRRVARHAAECPDCGPLLRGLFQLREALQAIDRASDVRASVVPQVLERVRREPAPRADAQAGETRR